LRRAGYWASPQNMHAGRSREPWLTSLPKSWQKSCMDRALFFSRGIGCRNCPFNRIRVEKADTLTFDYRVNILVNVGVRNNRMHTSAATIVNPHPLTNLVSVEQKVIIKRRYIKRNSVLKRILQDYRKGVRYKHGIHNHSDTWYTWRSVSCWRYRWVSKK